MLKKSVSVSTSRDETIFILFLNSFSVPDTSNPVVCFNSSAYHDLI